MHEGRGLRRVGRCRAGGRRPFLGLLTGANREPLIDVDVAVSDELVVSGSGLTSTPSGP